MSLSAHEIANAAIAGQGMPKPPASSKPGKRTIVSKADIVDQPEPR